MNYGIWRILGVIIGLAFIVLGLLATAGIIPRVPEPEWVFGAPTTFLGVVFYAYGISGRSRLLEKLGIGAD